MAQRAVNYIEQANISESTRAVNDLSEKDKSALLNWVENNFDNISPFYYIFFADEMFKKDKELAVYWFSIGSVRITEDAQMCEDKSAMSRLPLYAMMAPETVSYMMNDKDEKFLMNTLKRAIKWDNEHPNRYNPVWACPVNQENNESAKLLPSSEFEKIKVNTHTQMIEQLQQQIDKKFIYNF